MKEGLTDAMTYKDLFENISAMTEEELNQTVTIHIKSLDEYIPAAGTNRIVDRDVLDDGHFVIFI